MKITVTVEMEFNKLPDDAARELARQIVESKGLNVSKVAIVADKTRVKEFVPKAYAPGWTVKVFTGGEWRLFVVWDQAQHHKGKNVDLWVQPLERQQQDAPIYRFDGNRVTPHHGDGKVCSNQANYTGCQHQSHQQQTQAA